MIKIITENFKKYKTFIFHAFLWLCIWATYDTDASRIFNPGFPHNLLDLMHGLRSLLPFLALAVSVVILVKKFRPAKVFLKTPLGLLLIFTIVGMVSSIFSNHHFLAFYWGVLYGTVIIVLLSFLENKDSLKKIIIINWIIAGVLAVGLTVFFLIQPGAMKSLTFNLLICVQRPYEGLGNIGAAINTFGVAGTRPTGLGRYAGIATIISLTSFFCANKKKSKILWFFVSVIFLLILLFSKGKTEILAFIIAVAFLVWFLKKVNVFSILGLGAVFLISIFVIFYNIPCVNYVQKIQTSNGPILSKSLNRAPSFAGFFEQIFPGFSLDKTINRYNKATETVDIFEPQNAKVDSVVTLSGRTSGVWQDAWHLFLKNPLMGFGFQADRFFLSGQHAHDSIIHALIQAGILGTIPFVLAFILTLIILIRLLADPDIKGKERIFLVSIAAALIFFGIRGITESVAFFSADWLFVAPMIAYLQCLDNEARNNIAEKPAKMDFLGMKIDLVKMPEVLEKISYWVKNENGKFHWIVVTGMHGIVESERSAGFRYAARQADMFVPDGISLVWIARLKGFSIKKRISGADLMAEFLKLSEGKGFKNYFYGDTKDTLKILSEKFPKVKTDFYSPPFREVTEQEDEEIIEKINSAKPDVLWVGLGLPKQEKWIFSHRNRLNVPVVIGVGAAFKFLSGKVKRAPKWVGDAGFEWLWRFFQEPKVMRRRVFIDIPHFLRLVVEDFCCSVFKKLAGISSRQSSKKVLLFLEDYFLWPMGIFFWSKLLEQLIPYDVNGFEEKVRLGNHGDGGYVIPRKILQLIDVEYCYGVADHIDFEESLINYRDIHVRLYDHTVDNLPVADKRFFFKKQGIAEKKYGNFDTFKNHLAENGDRGKKIILKMDIEGGEWKVIDNIVKEMSEDIECIILEIHQLYRYEKIIRYINILKKINSKFTLVHLHGNNNSRIFGFGGKKITDALELTFINNNLIKGKKIMASDLPSEKDFPNIAGKKDIILNFWKDKNT